MDEYWIIDVAARRILMFSDPRDGAYQTSAIAEVGDDIAPRAFPDVTLSVRDLFV